MAFFKKFKQFRNKRKKIVGNFIIGKVLGIGSTSIVRLGIHKKIGYKVAIKIIKKKFLGKDEKRTPRLELEIAILNFVKHFNIITFYGFLETAKRVFLIFEFAEGGTLLDYIIQKELLQGKELLHLFNQVVLSVAYCHKLFVCHRDLKPDNLLLDENHNIKLTDFGLAQITKRWDLQSLKTFCGTISYTAPEILKGCQYDGQVSDVWSLGVILYTMSVGCLPFMGNNISILLNQILFIKFFVPNYVCPLVADLISKMLVVDVTKRIKIEDIKKHPFFSPLKLLIEPSRDIQALLPDPMKLRTCWNNNFVLDLSILQYMEAMGWGTITELQKTLMDDNFRTSNFSKLYRVDRATYMNLYIKEQQRDQTLTSLFSANTTTTTATTKLGNKIKAIKLMHLKHSKVLLTPRLFRVKNFTDNPQTVKYYGWKKCDAGVIDSAKMVINKEHDEDSCAEENAPTTISSTEVSEKNRYFTICSQSIVESAKQIENFLNKDALWYRKICNLPTKRIKIETMFSVICITDKKQDFEKTDIKELCEKYNVSYINFIAKVCGDQFTEKYLNIVCNLENVIFSTC